MIKTTGKKKSAVATAFFSALAVASVSIPINAEGLEEVIVTAQRRETTLQTTPIAISAYSGAALAEQKVFTVSDLAANVPSFSLTANTPLDVELNIRGITNTRLDSPSADPSVGTFVDGVYMGRTGDLNYDFFDLERIEIIRGPQGVLLGKNVVGGAMSISTAKPKFDSSGALQLSYGNYDARLLNGYYTGAITDTLAGRISIQTRSHDGYAQDIIHTREIDNLTSVQARAQFLYQPKDSDWTVRGIFNYNKDHTNGINVIAVDGGTPSCETSYLKSNCTRPWSNLRRYLGLTDPRKSAPNAVQYKGDLAPTLPFLRRKGFAFTLDLQGEFTAFTFNSLTGYTDGSGDQSYDQTGLGPEVLGWSVSKWTEYQTFVTATKPVGNGSNGLYLFAEPVAEKAEAEQFSQEFRLTSNKTDSSIDWITGIYFKQDTIDKTDHFIGEAFFSGLATLSGEAKWINNGKNQSMAAFGQVGYQFTDNLKLTAGTRYTKDEKKGEVQGLSIATGDRFNPADTKGLTPLGAAYAAGTGYTQAYGKTWSKMTPQVTLDFKPSQDLFLYATVSKGFKGGGFDDTPTNPAQAATPFNPEEATNYEIGIKSTLLDRRLRINADIFKMDYKNLQVTQTNAACLCNLTDNAAKANIKGAEAELEFLVTDNLRWLLAGSYVDGKYEDFLETAINPATGSRLVSSGNRMQRTPKNQVSTGIDYTANFAGWDDALHLSANYSWQSDMPWATDNIAKEKAYGLLDLRAAVKPKDKDWEVGVYGKNINDTLYRVNIIAFFGEEVSQFGAPRTFGIDVNWKF